MPVTRKLLRTVTASIAVLPNAAFALGLGPIEVESSLDQPLQARIPIVSLRPGEIEGLRAGLASRELFERMGFERPALLSQLTFSIENRGSGQPYIRLSSNGPIREPLLDLLVEVRWSSGRLLRDYAVLLDPPVIVRRPRPASAIAPYVARAGNAAPVRAAAPVRRTSTPPPAATMHGSDYGPVTAGETLWSIANSTRPDRSVSVQQMMLALLRANPHAFFQPNVNSLNAGATMRIPDRAEIASLTKDEALREVRQQYAGYSGVGETGTESTASVVPEQTEVAVKLSKPGSSMALEDQEQAPGPQGVEGGSAEQGPDQGDPRSALIRVENGGISLQLAGMDDLVSHIPTIVAVNDVGLAASAVSRALGDRIAATGAATDVVDQAAAPISEGESAAGAFRSEPPLESGAAKFAAQARTDGERAWSQQVGAEPAPLAAETVAVEDRAVVDEVAETGPLADSGPPTSTDVESADAELPPATVATPDASAELPQSAESAPANADPVSETAPVAAMEPALEEAELAPAPAWFTGILGILNDPRSLAIAGGGVLLFLLLVLLLARRALSRGAGGAPPPRSESPRKLEVGRAVSPIQVAPSVSAAPPAAPPPIPQEIAARAAPEPEPVADPAAKADVLLAMGDYADAVALLDEALATDSSRSDLAFKLLEAHHAQGSKEGYLRALESHRERLEGGRLWEQVLAMGTELAPEHPMFAAVRDDAESIWLPPAEEGSRAADDNSAPEPDQAQSEAARTGTGSPDVLEFVVPDREPKPKPKPAQEVDLDLEGGLDFDLDQFSLEDAAEVATEESKSEETDEVGVALEEEFRKLGREEAGTDGPLLADETLEIDLGGHERAPDRTADGSGGEVLDFPGKQDASAATDLGPSAEEDDSFVDTKLDLATAYLEMGDDAGARTLYEEVVEEGNDVQREQAKEALQRIGYG